MTRTLVLFACCAALAGCNGDKKPPSDAPVTPPVEATGDGDPTPGPDPGATPAPRGRLLILGFDGVDPRWLEKWSAEGKLPTIKKLIEGHGGKGYQHLASTNPPQSPVAWTSFATGTRPGAHGIFDFIGRSLGGPALPIVPKVATTSFEVPESGPPVARNLRTGRPFWQTLGNDGVRVVALNVPYSFPPDPMQAGRMLSGLGVPDLRGTNSTFAYAGTDVTDDQVARPPGGGAMIKLVMEGNKASFKLEGPSVPGKSAERMAIDVSLETGGAAPMTVTMGGKAVALELGKFSDWVTVLFEDGDRKVHGICRLLALEAGKQTRLFITPLSFHPDKPYSPVSYPREFSAQVGKDLGSLYKTVGWDHDTSALNAEVVEEGAWLADMEAIESDRKKMLMARLGKDDWDMLIWVSTATDRVAHMFYRLTDPGHPTYDAKLAAKYGTAIEDEYRRMDSTLSDVLATLKPDDTLLILSDHGFHGYRRGLHVNQWLRQAGLLSLKGGAAATSKQFFMDVDWSTTKAYAMGTGQVYVNLKGREAHGIVERADVAGVIDEVRKGLLALRDTDRDDAQVMDDVYVGAEVFQGGRGSDAPDAQLAFAEHYRTSWETILGGVPEALFADNPRKWSGDHAASDVKKTAGILISNRPLSVADAEIVDLAPTALSFFGKEAPGHYVGKPLLAPGAAGGGRTQASP